MKYFNTIFVIGNIDNDKINSITEYSVLVSKNDFLIFTREVDMARTNLKTFREIYSDQIRGTTIDDYFTFKLNENVCNDARFKYSNLSERFLMQNGKRNNDNKSDLEFAQITYRFLAQKYGKDVIYALNAKLLTHENYQSVLYNVFANNLADMQNYRIKIKRLYNIIQRNSDEKFDPWNLGQNS